MELLLTLLGYVGLVVLVVVSLGGFAASVACALAVLISNHG